MLSQISAASAALFNRPEKPSHLTIEQMENDLLFGCEMTVSSEELLASYPSTSGLPLTAESSLAREKIKQIKAQIRADYRSRGEAAPLFSESRLNDWNRTRHTITYRDHFSLTFFADPGVIELNCSPVSVTQFERNSEIIQRDFFDQAQTVGLTPALFTGSGHIHIDTKKVHPVTFRNFLVDLYNTTGLAAGALNEDVYNALGPGELPTANKELIQKAFQKFDSEKNSDVNRLYQLLQPAYSISHSNDLPEYQKARKWSRPAKYFAYSFASYTDIGTLELRAIRPQASANSFLKLIRLLKARMQLAEKKRLRGENVVIGDLPSLRGEPQKVLAQFDQYVTEAGLTFEDYKEFILPWWQLPGGEWDIYWARRGQSAQKSQPAQAVLSERAEVASTSNECNDLLK